MTGDESNVSAAQRAHLARVRDNQRRSRARRKEYLQELEEKYRKCEQQGIEASAEMQHAARRVLDENKRLRAALRQRDLSEEEIELYARGLEPESATSTLERMLSANTLSASNVIGNQDDPRLLSRVSTEDSVEGSSSKDLSHSPVVPHSSASGVLNLMDGHSQIHPRRQFDQHQPYQPISPSSESQNLPISIDTSLPPTLPSSSPSTSSANPTPYVNSFPPTPSSYASFPSNNNHRPNQHQQFPVLPSNEPWPPLQTQLIQGTQQSVPTAINYTPGYQPLLPQHVQDRRGITHYESAGEAPGFPSHQGFGISPSMVDGKPSGAGPGEQLWGQEQWQQQHQQQQQQQQQQQARRQPPRRQEGQGQTQQRLPSNDRNPNR